MSIGMIFRRMFHIDAQALLVWRQTSVCSHTRFVAHESTSPESLRPCNHRIGEPTPDGRGSLRGSRLWLSVGTSEVANTETLEAGSSSDLSKSAQRSTKLDSRGLVRPATRAVR
jgi:hypothetical protein